MPLPTLIRPARPEDLTEIGHLLALAFDEPVTRWLVPDPARRPVVMPRFFAAVAGDALATGTVDLLCDAHNGYPFAAAVWFDHTRPTGTGLAPGHEPDDERWERIFGAELDRWEIMDGAMARAHHPGPHWYLMCVGVRPHLQGQGLGSRLLTHRHTRLTSDTYLEATTPDSRRLYTRLGYATLGELPLPAGPTMWPMLRPDDVPVEVDVDVDLSLPARRPVPTRVW